MDKLRNWDDTDKQNKNDEIANSVFAMFLCARFFVLKHLLKKLPPDTDPMTARRRWVLFQVMPPYFGQKDIFNIIFGKLRQAESDVLIPLTKSILISLPKIAGNHIFPQDTDFHIVIDEAQCGVEYLKQSFHSTTSSEMRPVLHPFYTFLWGFGYFRGVIIAGTGLSMKMVKEAVGSQSAKLIERPAVFVDVGRFKKGNGDHENYIRKYLPQLPQTVVDRVTHWFTGR